MNIPSITIISSTISTAMATKQQLTDCFKDTVSFKTVVFSKEIEPYSINDDWILITNAIICDEALTYIKPGCMYFVTDRTISMTTISSLYDIPEGSDVLLFNVTKDTVEEALTQLTACGIKHLNFFPCHPGIETYRSDCPYAITFGEADLVPPGQYKIIDLGNRPVDTTSCIKIAIDVGVYEQVKRNISTISMRPGIELSYSYAKQLTNIRLLTGNLQLLLNYFSESILLVDNGGQVQLFNPQAHKLLEIRDNSSPYLQPLLHTMKSKGANFFLDIKGHNYYVESFYNLQVDFQSIVFIIKDMESIHEIEQDYRKMLLASGFVAQYAFDDVICKSDKMKQLLQKSQQFAKSDSTIYIHGESGCGKELIAQAIHNASGRKKEAFVAVNFAALSATLSEAELFGYVDGAFTGAKKGGQKGLFELAHKGTIFLDEIGDCSLDVQKKILRVIQERKVMPIGGNKLVSIDIRIIVATNQNLYKMVANNEFREDLYYRLNVLPLKVPALRERKDDILPLFTYFMNEVFDMHLTEIPGDLTNALLEHPWRGNVRELRNIAEYISNCMISNIPWQDQRQDIFHSELNYENRRNSDSSQMSQLICAIEAQCELITAYKVLNIINSPPYLWNRSTVTDQLSDAAITESKTKRLLSVLKQYGLIQSKTGQGSYINQLGRDFINHYEAMIKQA